MTAISLLLGAASAQAATIAVTSNSDRITNSATRGCTLREAIESLNTGTVVAGCVNSGGTFGSSDTVDLTGRSRLIRLRGEQIDINAPMTINGPGAHKLRISGKNVSRIFRVLHGSPTTISGLTLTQGLEYEGGAVMSFSDFTLTDCIVSENAANQYGGGVFVSGGTATLINSTVSGNSLADPGSFGGGVTATNVTLTNSTVSGNSAANGGGVSTNGGNLTLTNSTVSGNAATAAAGGVSVLGGNVTLTNSTVSGNSAASTGGLEVVGNATLINSTVAFNDSTNNGFHGVYRSGTLTLTNSLIVGTGTGCHAPADTNTASLATDASCTGAATPIDGITGINLGPLADNGGTTQTHALLQGSVAIDTGNAGACQATDQRGATRALDGDNSGSSVCDVGAFERANLVAAALACPMAVLPCITHTRPASATLRTSASGVSGSLSLRNVNVSAGDIADPATSPYRVCAYVDGSLVDEWGAAAGDPDLTLANGTLRYRSRTNELANLMVKPGAGKGQIRARLKNGPALPLGVTTAFTTQFVNNNACWSQTWTPSQIRRNDDTRFQALDRDKH